MHASGGSRKQNLTQTKRSFVSGGQTIPRLKKTQKSGTCLRTKESIYSIRLRNRAMKAISIKWVMAKSTKTLISKLGLKNAGIVITLANRTNRQVTKNAGKIHKEPHLSDQPPSWETCRVVRLPLRGSAGNNA